ncbi:retrovirus-related Pol polyprotein from transposon 412 [Nephila pilipes]|uniref:Retrovirus-related Pol polyprotein from transposon 412 n=1 Tax=Nephila pilipes TaxID=299642 RepID=A0A8X6NZB9_NEPPI|nr:retrovirus-related Pol polyprotein from transposon 412 [Nephila pilipes]
MKANIVSVINTKIDVIADKVDKNEERLGEIEKNIEKNEERFGEITLEIGKLKEAMKVYKTQIKIVANGNGWDPVTKARQLASSLRAEAADILRTVPEEEQLNFEALTEALELRFGEKCLKDFSHLQLKSRQQRQSETLQDLATDVERLSHLSFADCPANVRDTLTLQYFIDGVKDSEIQEALRLSELKDLKSALVYGLKYEAAEQASRRERHLVRGRNNQFRSWYGGYSERKSGGGNEFFIKAHVNKLPCRMIVDTGANVTIMREDIAQ